MLESLRINLGGRVATRLQSSVAARASSLLEELLVEAVRLWEAEEFRRYDEGEISCTIRLFDCCDRVVSSAKKWALVHVQYDGAQPTRATRRGDESPKFSPRPDMNVRFGQVLVDIEAKRLEADGNLPGRYVREGMRRFITGRYPSHSTVGGVMLAYVQHDPPRVGVAAVNRVIEADPDMADSEVLSNSRKLSSRFLIHDSYHASIRIVHHVIDLRADSE